MRLLDGMPEIEKTSVFGTSVHAVLHRDPRVAVPAIKGRLEAAGIAVGAIEAVQPSLEDVFLEVVEQKAAVE
jgi:hypothetical protein